jgi:Rps23 Pro-64 3,4-dihydroxylase Tpa1-like proline 4-hydroxylase
MDSSIEKQEVFPGIWVYKNKLNKDIIEKVESFLQKYPNDYNWAEATVGYAQKIPSYRDCVDFKIQKHNIVDAPESRIELNKIWQYAYDMQIDAVKDYCKMYSIEMNYWEAMNFIKYGPGQHFQEHSDHGFSYIATVSLVSYPNDDYEGGELYFPKLKLTITPEAGDIVIFPSTYLFSHVAKPVKSGTKYSIVTMLDYNDNTHNPDFDLLRMKKMNSAVKRESDFDGSHKGISY